MAFIINFHENGQIGLARTQYGQELSQVQMFAAERILTIAMMKDSIGDNIIREAIRIADMRYEQRQPKVITGVN